MPGRDAVASHGSIKSVICWLHPRVHIEYTLVKQTHSEQILHKDKRYDREDKAYELNLILTHFVHFFDDISRVYLDNDNSLEF